MGFMRLFTLFALLYTLVAADATKGLKRPVTDKSGQTLFSYAHNYALLIGVSDYTNGWPDLESIPGELQKIRASLEAKGFVVETVMNPAGKALKNAYERFIDAHGFDAGNRLLFFYSGHGHSEGGRGYLVPADAPDPRVDLKQFKVRSLAMSTLLAMARRMDARHALFLFDSCFSGTIFKTRALPKAPPYIETSLALPVRQFISAGSAGEEVPAKSTFAMMFIDAIEGRGDLNHDGYITGSEVGMYLSQNLPTYEKQSPQYGKINDYELSRGDFIFFSAQASRAVKAPVDTAESTPPRAMETAPPPRSPSMIRIKAGSFTLGSRRGSDDEQPERRVTFARDFEMDTYETTFAAYDRFCEATGRPKPDDNGWGRGERPVINVSWEDATAYAAWLSERHGQTYRLPTEAEWEYAARAGSTSDYGFGTDRSQLGRYGWYRGNASRKSHPVGTLKANAWGLYDLHGNVAEWCADWYNGSHHFMPTDGSAVPFTKQRKKVYRGGSWTSGPQGLRAPARKSAVITFRSNAVGFRLVRER